MDLLKLEPSPNSFPLVSSREKFVNESTNKINAVGRSPYFPGHTISISLPANVETKHAKEQPPRFLENSCLVRQLQLNETAPAGISLRKRKAGKENNPSPQPSKKSRVCMEQATTHVGDHYIIATEVCASILADGIDVTVINQGCDLLKQYIDTIFGAVPGFVLNIDT